MRIDPSGLVQAVSVSTGLLRQATRIRHTGLHENILVRRFNGTPPRFWLLTSTTGGSSGTLSQVRHAKTQVVSNARPYIRSPAVVQLIDRLPRNRQLREAFRFQEETMCYENALEALARVAGTRRRLWSGYSHMLQPPRRFTENTHAAELKASCGNSSPLMLLLYGSGRGYASFHINVLSCVLDVDGRHVGIMYDGNDQDTASPVLRAAVKFAAENGGRKPHEITKNELRRLDPQGQAFPRLVDLEQQLVHAWAQWKMVEHVMAEEGVKQSPLFPPPEMQALAQDLQNIASPDPVVIREIQAYLKDHPELIETRFPSATPEDVRAALRISKADRKARDNGRWWSK